MAFHLRDSEELGDLAEINVTPLVDVMLVLLVIFMVTAPLMTQGLEVALPSAEGKSFETAADATATVQILSNGGVYLDGVPVGTDQLELSLGPMLRARRIKRARLEADQA